MFQMNRCYILFQIVISYVVMQVDVLHIISSRQAIFLNRHVCVTCFSSTHVRATYLFFSVLSFLFHLNNKSKNKSFFKNVLLIITSVSPCSLGRSKSHEKTVNSITLASTLPYLTAKMNRKE